MRTQQLVAYPYRRTLLLGLMFMLTAVFWGRSLPASATTHVWEFVTDGPDASLVGLSHGNGTWVVTDRNGSIYWEENGAWTMEKVGPDNGIWYDAHYVEANDTWILAGRSPSWESTIAVGGPGAWQIYEGPYGTDSLSRIAVGSTHVMILGDNGIFARASLADLSVWTRLQIGTDSLGSVAYGNGMFVIVGAQGEILISTDEGATFGPPTSVAPQPPTSSLFGVTYGGGTFVAVGAKGTILTSADGLNWTLSIYEPFERYVDVAYGANMFVVVSLYDAVISSPDAVNWSLETTRDKAGLGIVQFGNGEFRALGGPGLYRRTSNQKSDNSDLADLAVSPGSLDRDFDAEITSYTQTVMYDVDSLTVTPTVVDVKATVTVNTDTIASGDSADVSLNVGANTINVVVTAEDGTKKTYKIVVTRVLPAPAWAGDTRNFVDDAVLKATVADAPGNWHAVFSLFADSDYSEHVDDVMGSLVAPGGTSTAIWPISVPRGTYYVVIKAVQADISSLWAEEGPLRFNRAPEAPTTLDPFLNAWVNTGTPTLSWTFTDPDGSGDAQDAYQVQIVRLDDSLVLDTGEVGGKSSGYQEFYTLSADASLPDGAQSYKWRVRTWDIDGAEGPYTPYAFFRVDATPPTGTVSLGGSTLTTSRTVTLTLAATDATSDVKQMRFSTDDETWSAWEAYGTSKTYTLPEGDGTKTVYVQFVDAAGNVSDTASDSILLDTAPPIGSILINGGASATNQSTVTLTLSATDAGMGVSGMRFSTDGQTWSAWEAYGTSKTYTLPAGDGTKTVYVQFQDDAGHAPTTVSASISLDTTPPSAQAGALPAYQNSYTFDLPWSGGDAGSGLDYVQLYYSEDGGNTWELYGGPYTASPIEVKVTQDGHYSFSVVAVDKAGNWEATPAGPGSVERSTLVDTVAPSAEAKPPSQYQTAILFNVEWEGTDVGSGVDYVRLYFSMDGGSMWRGYGNVFAESPITFVAPINGTYHFSVVAVDKAGNAEELPDGSGSIEASTVVDTVAPKITVSELDTYQLDRTFDLFWTGDDGAGSGLAAVKLYYRADGGNWTQYETTFTASPIRFTAADDGMYDFIAVGVDIAGNEEDVPGASALPEARTLVDTVPPSAEVAVELDAYQRSRTFAIEWQATDAGGSGIAHVKLYYSTNNGTTWTQYQTTSTSPISFTAPTDGMYAFSIVGVDEAGNAEAEPAGAGSIEASTVVDQEGPQNVSIEINGGAIITPSASVTLSLSAMDAVSAMGDMRFSTDGGGTWEDWEPYQTEVTYELPTGDGMKTVTAQFRDKAGNESAVASADILLDTTAPTAWLDALPTYQTSRTFDLTGTADDDNGSGVRYVKLFYSVDGGETWTQYQGTFTGPVTFEAEHDGPYAFSLVAVDRAGNEMPQPDGADAIQVSTLVDTQPPVTELDELSGYQSSHTFDIGWTADDGAGSGIDHVKLYYSVDDGDTWTQYEDTFITSPISFTADGDGAYAFSLIGVDKVGHEETAPDAKAATVVDTVAPEDLSIRINNGAASTTASRVTLTLGATDATSGVAEMRFSTDDGATWSAWERYGSTRSFALPSGLGKKTVTVQFRDQAGNESASVSAEIRRSAPEPPAPAPAPAPDETAPTDSTEVPPVSTDSPSPEPSEVRVDITVTGAPSAPAVLAALAPAGGDQVTAVAVGAGEIEAALAAAEEALAPGAAATPASVTVPVTNEGGVSAVVLDPSGVQAVVGAQAEVVVRTPYATLVIPPATVAQAGGTDPAGRMVVLVEDVGEQREDVSEQVGAGLQQAVSPVVEVTLATLYPDGSLERHHQMRVPVTLALPYDPAQTEDAAVGIYLLLEDENGQVIGRLYVGGTADPSSGTVTVERPTLSKYVVLATRRYVDVPADHWAQDHIYNLTLRGTVTGVTATTYEPDREVTRAEFATMMARALALPADSAALAAFPDAEAGAWYEDTVGAAVKAGLLKGYTDGTLRPEGQISREEMATVLARVLEQRYGRPAPTAAAADSVLAAYADGEQAVWSRGALAMLVESALMQGRTATELAPKGIVTRAEATTMLRRMLELVSE